MCVSLSLSLCMCVCVCVCVRVDEPPGSRMILVDLLAVDEDPADHRNLARLLTSVSSHVDCTSTYSLGTTNTILSGR